MIKPHHLLIILILSSPVHSCRSQTDNPIAERRVGGACEGCEGLLEYGDRRLSSTDSLPGFAESSAKLKIKGTVYLSDGKTPASNVIVYIYHTNAKGIYPKGPDAKGWGRRHGYIRGWIKTGDDGQYEFYTFRPGAYPQRSAPAHIHVIVKEPDTIPYYLDDYTFDDDPLLTTDHRRRFANKGGSGIMKPRSDNGMMIIKRDLVLGLNITDY